MSFRKTEDFVPKILILLGFSLLTALSRVYGFSVAVMGTVMDSEGVPVEGVDVFITTIFEDSTFFFSSATSDLQGMYTEVIPVPNGQTSGQVSISSIGCNGTFAHFTRSWSDTETMIMQDFIWCDDMDFPDSCVALILPNQDPVTELTMLYAVSSAQEPASYVWNDGSTGQSVIAIDTGMYCVTITGANTCSASACYAFGLATTDCFVSISPGNGGDGALEAMGFGVAPLTYLWSTGDTSRQVSVGESGTFCVTVTDAAGCVSQECYNYITGTADIWAGELIVEPQPVVDVCRIVLPTELYGNHTLVISSVTGQAVKCFYNIFREDSEAWLDVGDLLPGMYVMRLEAGQKIWLSKLIKQLN